MNKKVLFWTVYLLILSVGPVTVLKNTPLSSATSNSVIFVNFLQRIVGTLAFTLIFFQIIFGAWMQVLTEKLGGWIFKLHITEGAIAYVLIFTHPLLFILFNYKLKGIFDPFYVFAGFNFLNTKSIEFFYSFGRLAFWLITVAVLAAKLRTQPWLTSYWRKFHILNYVAFFLIAVHSYFVGTDAHSAPFVWFYWTTIMAVVISFLYRRVYMRLKEG